jgi:hypothetical protein
MVRYPIKIKKAYRPRSKIDNLSPEAQELIREWFIVEDATYSLVKRRARERFGIILSITGLQAYWQRVIAPELIAKNQSMSGFTIEVIIRQGGRIVAVKTVEALPR